MNEKLIIKMTLTYYVHTVLRRIQRQIAKNRRAVNLAVCLRNQCEWIIGFHLGETDQSEANGENQAIEWCASECHRFIDVGANVGTWSEIFLKYAPEDSMGLLFEPSRAALTQLKQRLGCDQRVAIIPKAAGAYIGEIEFNEEPNGGETSSLVPGVSIASAVQTTVSITTVDAETNERGWESVDYLKVDAEGYDLLVLQGAKQLIEGQKIGVIQFEYNRFWALSGSTLSSVYQLLESNGYSVYLLTSRGLFRFDYAKYGEFYRYSNFLAFSPKMIFLAQEHIQGII